jgi:chemotaxis protein methyltransferase CheR
VDLNPLSLARARKGVYSPWSLRDTAPRFREAYFEPGSKEQALRPAIRGMVAFEQANLAEPNAGLWAPGSWDLVLFRNVLMYLTPEAASAAVARVAAGLAPGGFLFLGYAETLRGLSQDFHLCHTHDCFYYQRMDGTSRAAAAPQRHQAAAIPEATAWDPDTSWVEAIRRASERIAGLAAPAPAAPAGAPAASGGLDASMEFFKKERFAEALEALPKPEGMADATLLRAVILLGMGRLDEAEEACRALLAADELNAGAHYVLALCREHAGDLKGASEEDQAAAYLDPGFAMPRLHLGLMARRAGRQAEARREMEQALALLAREDSSRLLFFGGGFSREGLAELCRSGLRSMEAA